MQNSLSHILLVNPWVYDFAAYDFWVKPLGLLQLGGVLKKLGYSLELLDCLDRFHPLIENPEPSKENGNGKFFKDELPKPQVLSHIPRKYSRYGLPIHLVRKQLALLNQKPDVILVTSIMTYWYEGVRDMISLLRDFFLETPILLGGVYASLAPQHALEVCKPDAVINGQDLSQTISQITRYTHSKEIPFIEPTIDKQPFPVYDLYPKLESLAVTTSKGCPNRCSFCASHILSPHYERRPPKNVVDEIAYWFHHKNIKHVAFYDDALLHRPEKYIKPILRMCIDQRLKVQFHTPNGLQPRFVDEEFAELFYRAGGKTIRLSFETTNTVRQKEMTAKINNNELERAVTNLEKAGFKRNEIGVYVLMGLFDQTMEEVYNSCKFVLDLGATVKLASFSPVPGTSEWEKALAKGVWNKENDLLQTNTSIHPIWSNIYGYEKCQELMQWVFEQNSQLILES